ncbi:type I restriction/modification system, S subunit [Campylobacter lanienae NCTC 13004]|uniref:Type I restriction/modification system, S subunit n=1 Tax=Campylobacter lanienae NCTC 13004 TaxID=1031753 RepID=A0A1X9SKZ7_9BACT|nr:restriction endonuclease subunit S [Campylobacter lanienae]ARQ96890.1 type I restriction/modification system, S subunit [Campylobacter lanienae NCTC 13004]
MSKLEELINKLCPNGVEFKKIEEVCDNVFAGGTPRTSNKDYYGGNIPWLRSGEINFNIIDDAEIKITEKGLNESSAKWIKEYSVLIAMTGATVARSAVNIKRITANQSVCAMEPSEIVNYKFLYYYVESMYNNIKGMAQGALTSINLSIIKSISIPVPPLEVQCEIVRILDNFTLLSAELSAELSARQKQYEYYSKELFNFNDDVEFISLESIADIGTGSSNTNEAVEDGQYPFYVRSQQVYYKNNYEYDDNSIITSGDGVGVGKIFHYTDGKYALHQRAYRINITNNKVNSKYFYYYMKSTFYDYIQKNAFNSSVTSIRRPMLNKYPIPILSLEKQNKIVNILEKFDKLCNDLSEGLPAEIEARKKQYEYYRDKLLTFKELKS